MAPGEEQFPLLAADMAPEERGQPPGNRIQFFPERGKLLCFLPPEKGVQDPVELPYGSGGVRKPPWFFRADHMQQFPCMPAGYGRNVFKFGSAQALYSFFIPRPGQELEVPFRRQRRYVSMQGDIQDVLVRIGEGFRAASELLEQPMFQVAAAHLVQVQHQNAGIAVGKGEER